MKYNKKLWDKIAHSNQESFILFKSLQEDGCIWCKVKKFNFANMVFHIQETHGLPREAFFDLIKELN